MLSTSMSPTLCVEAGVVVEAVVFVPALAVAIWRTWRRPKWDRDEL